MKHYFWHGEAGGGLTTMGASYVVCLGSIFGFLWLVPSWEWGQTGDLAVLAQVLTTMGPLVPRPCSGSLGWCCRASVLLSYIVLLLSVYIFTLLQSLPLFSDPNLHPNPKSVDFLGLIIPPLHSTLFCRHTQTSLLVKEIDTSFLVVS